MATSFTLPLANKMYLHNGFAAEPYSASSSKHDIPVSHFSLIMAAQAGDSGLLSVVDIARSKHSDAISADANIVYFVDNHLLTKSIAKDDTGEQSAKKKTRKKQRD